MAHVRAMRQQHRSRGRQKSSNSENYRRTPWSLCKVAQVLDGQHTRMEFWMRERSPSLSDVIISCSVHRDNAGFARSPSEHTRAP